MTSANDAVTETLARVNDTLAEMQKTQEAAVAASRKVDVHAADPDAHGGGAGAGVDLSDAVNSASSTTAASSKAVKTAYDKAVAAQTAASSAQTTASSALTKAEQALSGSGGGSNAATAIKLVTARAVDGVNFDGSANITHYATCSTAAGTAAKVVSLAGFTLVTGAEITVRFSATNTAANPTLNVNGTGAKPVQYRNAAITAGALAANRTYSFVYDGSSWELVGDLDTNTICTPAGASPKAPGTAAVGTSAKYAREDHVHPVQTAISGNAGTATRLATARSVRINLASQSAVNFDGSANITPGVSGTLGVANGGTGRTDGKAAALATPRTITLTGAVTGSVSFDGSKNVSLATVIGGGLVAGRPLTQVYTSNATFTVPPGVTRLLVVCIGAGADGGSVTSITSFSGGGSGGAAASVYVDVTPGQNIPVTVGKQYSRTSSFGTFLSCSNTVTTSLPIQMQSKAGSGADAKNSNLSGRQNAYCGSGGGGFNPTDWYTFALAGPSSPPSNGSSVHLYNLTEFPDGGAGFGIGADGGPVHTNETGVLCGGNGGTFGGGGGATIKEGAVAYPGIGAPGAVVVLW